MIVLLLAAWAVLLLPSFPFGKRAQASPMDGVRRFSSTMGILASTRATQVPGRWVMVPKDMNSGPQRRRSRIVRRRRQAFMRLLATALMTLVIGLLPGMHALLLVHLVVDLSIVAYVFQLRRWARQERPRARRPVTPEPAEATVHHIEPIDEPGDRKVELPEEDLVVSR